MNEHKAVNIVKEVAWNLFVFVLYYAYCFVMLLIAHFLLYRFIKSMNWTLRDIALYALIASIVVMTVRIVGLVKKAK